ncbi:MAG: hypothetical protein B6D41_02795 [Chloroflexi bacterium UTCFX4]|jgi:succinate dehydrogenase/fumarate reductase cytochrome b subunit|nr:MAG: hypothetical protein B6D41_02795 [Chloroflexi bacterium UTCFX4]
MTAQTPQPRLEKTGSIAAFVNAFTAGASLLVAVAFIGLGALSDPQQLAALAIANPMPLLAQDLLKFVSAATASILIVVLWKRLRDAAPTLLRVATAFGFLAVGLLLVNAVLSIFAVSQAANFSASDPNTGNALNGIIGLLGLAVIVANGVWYLLVNWAALKSGLLPRGLCWLGLVVGAVSLVPFLALGVLILGAVWAVWLGVFLWRAK